LKFQKISGVKMSSLAAVSTTEGQGRLWERMALQDMNLRIEHLMQSLTGNQKYDPALVEQVKKEYENDMKKILDKIGTSVDNRIKDWENSKIKLNEENVNLKNEIDNLKNEKKHLNSDNKNVTAMNQKLQIVINNLSSNHSNVDDAKLRDMHKLKDNLENEKKHIN